MPPYGSPTPMNISRLERRVMNALALGGRILLIRDDDGTAIDVECYTREGWILSDCTFAMFKSLRAKKFVASQNSGPYRITRHGLLLLRSP